MKSSEENLKNRGFIDNIESFYYKDLELSKLYELLNSKIAYERSLAVNLLSQRIDINNLEFTQLLLEKLLKEKALYTKLEICKVLEKGNQVTCSKMIDYLGKIGNNQYKKVPLKVSKKISYPLPRDIIARTIGHMNLSNIDVLLNKIKDINLEKLSELLDAIGFMIFYNNELNTLKSFNVVKSVIEEHKSNQLIVWKAVECMSAFKLEEAKYYLLSLKNTVTNSTILLEIDRSLKLINRGEFDEC